MHGTNNLRKQELREDGALQIHEIFLTLQGEGPFSGRRAVFIRTTGCMLRCYWCFGMHTDDHIPQLVTTFWPDKKLNEVAVGDKLLTLVDKKLEETEVVKVHKREVDSWVEFLVNSTVYYVTEEHPIFTVAGLKKASELVIGDRIISAIFGEEVIKAVSIVTPQTSLKHKSSLTVYNVTCSPHNTYLLDYMWVHNCDTEWNDKDDPTLTVEQIVQQVKEEWGDKLIREKLVVLTGGDPLRQNIVPLIHALSKEGFHVQIETAGVYWLPGLDECVGSPFAASPPACSIVCSPKTASVNPKIEEHCSYWKYIIKAEEQSPKDGLPVRSTQMPGYKMELFRPPNAYSTVYVQPCDEGNEKKNSANTAAATSLALTYGYSLCLQTHKIVGVP